MVDDEAKYIGDEFIEETDDAAGKKDDGLAGLYDLVLPPGVPHKLIMEAVDKFNLEIATRKCALKTLEVDTENLLVLRGELEAVNNAHSYIYDKMSEKYNYKKS